MLQYCLLTVAIIWLLAVYKVFILDDGMEYTERINEQRQKGMNIKLKATTEESKIAEFVKQSNTVNLSTSTKKLPISVGAVRRPKKVETLPVNMEKQPHELKWPPVLADGTISSEDGEETMPLVGLKVPKFWSAPEGVPLNSVGSRVNGEETIFLMIASYRDFQCRETITSAFSRADHPERLFIAAVDQTVPGDTGCLDLAVPCSEDASQPICRYRDQISVYHMDAQFATGPVTARHVGDRMYRGEYFVMQMDAHCLFVNHWDSQIIAQWRLTHNEMAVLR